MMSNSVRTTTPQFEKKVIPRFRRLDIDHISAIETLYKSFPFLTQRVEIHMPYSRAKSTFSNNSVWVWPKFDKRPVGYLIFMEGFAPCIWYPERQEGMTFRWLLPPNFCQKGPIICLANILAGESVLQIEDIIVHEGKDLWSNMIYSQRWEILRTFWQSLPVDQPLLAFKPQIVKPIRLSEWSSHYDPSIYWIIQADHSRQPRWFWKDTVTVPEHKPVEFIPPTLQRSAEIHNILVAYCIPYTKMVLPDTYALQSQEGNDLGIASISTLSLSSELRRKFNETASGIVVEVRWNEEFNKYQIMRIMPDTTPITTNSFFYHKTM
jgi:hypothetical protein